MSRSDEYSWPGFFTSDRLHRVAAGNARRLSFKSDRGPVFLGLAECGAACAPSPSRTGEHLPLCPLCFPEV